MSTREKLAKAIEANAAHVKFADLARLCEACFGPPVAALEGCFIYKTPWPADPRLAIQEGPGGRSWPQQVRLVLAALRKMRGGRDG